MSNNESIHDWISVSPRESFGYKSESEEKREDTSITQEEIDEKRKQAKSVEPLNYGLRFVWDAFKFLLEKGQAWENIVMSLNWKLVYSFGVKTEDDLYLQYYWKTKLDREREIEKSQQEREVQKEKNRLEKLEKMPWWIEEGKKYIDESKWEEWENFVKNCDLYDWKLIPAILELLKLIDDGESWINVQKAFDNQGHSNYSYRNVRSRVVYFSKKWKEASRKLDN